MSRQPLSLSLSSQIDADRFDPEANATPVKSETGRAPASAAQILEGLQKAIAVSSSDVETILHWIAQAAQKFTGADGVAVAVRRDGAVVCCGRGGEMAPGLGARLSVDSGFSGVCLITGKMLRCDDSWQDPRVDLEVCQRMGLRSMAAVPVLGPHGVMGILETFSGQPRAFTDEHLNFLARLAEITRRVDDSGSIEATSPSVTTLAATLPDTPVEEVPTSEPALIQLPNRRAWAQWLIGAAVVAVVCALFFGATLLQKRQPAAVSPSSTVRPAPIPNGGPAPEVASPGTAKPSASGSASPGLAMSTPASTKLQPASQVQIQLGPRTVVPEGTSLASPTQAVESAAEKSGAAADVEAPEIASIAGKENLGLVSSAVAMPSLGAPTSQLSQAVLVHQIQPVYPVQALPLRLEGPVVMQAMIGEDGKVHHLKVLSGHPMLARAATDAVGQWRYQPFMLNGKPVQMETKITVNFKMP